MPSREKKEKYFAHLKDCFEKYPRCFIVHVDYVGSKQLQNIRLKMRGSAEIVMGKNTQIRRAIRNFMEEGMDHLECLLEVMRGNVGFVFTAGDLGELRKIIDEETVPALAKAGVIAPVDVIIPKGNTGLDPAQTSFFQALNVATKINKGQIEIIADCHCVKKDTKVGSSEAALLMKLGIKPFTYGLKILTVYESGAMFPLDVLDISDEVLMGSWSAGVRNMACLSLGVNYPTAVSLPHLVLNSFKSILAVAVEVDYDMPQAKKVKEILADPEAFAAMCAAAGPAPTAAAASSGGAAAEKAPEPEPEPEEESDEDMGFGLFD